MAHFHQVKDSENAGLHFLRIKFTLEELLVLWDQLLSKIYGLNYLVRQGRDDLQKILVHEVQVGLLEVGYLVRQLKVILDALFYGDGYFRLEQLMVLLLLYLVFRQNRVEKHYFDGFELFVSEEMVLDQLQGDCLPVFWVFDAE